MTVVPAAESAAAAATTGALRVAPHPANDERGHIDRAVIEQRHRCDSGVQPIGPGDDSERDREVADRRRDRADDGPSVRERGGTRHMTGQRHPAEAGFETRDATPGGGQTDAATGVAPERERDDARGDERGRARGRSAGRAGRVVRVPRRPVYRVVGVRG